MGVFRVPLFAALLLQSIGEASECQDCREDKVSGRHPPAPDCIASSPTRVGAISALAGEDFSIPKK